MVGAVRQFRFHLLSIDTMYPDDRGVELPSYEEAVIEGYRAARDMAQEIQAAGGNPSEYALRVEATNGVRLADIAFTEALPPSAPVAHAMTSVDGRFLDVDDTFCEILQRVKRDICDKSVLDITASADRFRNAHLLAALLSRGTSFTIRKRYLRADQSWAWVENHVSAFRDGAGGQRLVAAVRLLLPHEAGWEATAKQGGMLKMRTRASDEVEAMQTRLHAEITHRLSRPLRSWS